MNVYIFKFWNTLLNTLMGVVFIGTIVAGLGALITLDKIDVNEVCKNQDKTTYEKCLIDLTR